LLFCGHIGKLELDAAGIAISFTNVTGLSVGVGLTTACDTIISQACGGGNHYKVGVTIQRGILILALVMLPIWCIWLNAETILLLLQQNQAVAKMAGSICKILIIGLPGNFLYTILRKYLQCQKIVKPFVIVGLIVIACSALAHYITVFVLNLGIFGAAGALVFSQLLQPVICLAVIRNKRLGKKTWNGWSWESMSGWWAFLRLAIPSALMLCIEWWSFEIVTFVAGIVSEEDLAASIILFQVFIILIMVPVGLAVCTAVRIGTFLGANRPYCARRAAWVAVGLTAIWSTFNALLLFIVRSYIGYLFSSNKDVIELVKTTMPVVSGFIIMDFLQGTLQGVYRGAGRQKTGALLNMIGCYLVGLPIGIPLALVGEQGVKGLWIGMCCGVSIMFFGGFLIMFRYDWEDEAKKAQKRIGVISLSIDNTLGDTHSAHSEVSTNFETIEMSTTTDSIALLANISAPEDDNNAEAETININDDESETTNLKFEAEAGSSLSSSQKRRLFFKRLLIAVLGVLLVAGAAVTSNFTPSYTPRSNLCDSNLNINLANATYGHISNCTALFSTTIVPVTSLVLQYSSPQAWRTATSALYPSITGHASLVLLQPGPSPVMSLHSSRQATGLPFGST
jgi:MATE family multidrug resistance protein